MQGRDLQRSQTSCGNLTFHWPDFFFVIIFLVGRGTGEEGRSEGNLLDIDLSFPFVFIINMLFSFWVDVLLLRLTQNSS